jgi:hypothetical protein
VSLPELQEGSTLSELMTQLTKADPKIFNEFLYPRPVNQSRFNPLRFLWIRVLWLRGFRSEPALVLTETELYNYLGTRSRELALAAIRASRARSTVVHFLLGDYTKVLPEIENIEPFVALLNPSSILHGLGNRSDLIVEYMGEDNEYFHRLLDQMPGLLWRLLHNKVQEKAEREAGEYLSHRLATCSQVINTELAELVLREHPELSLNQLCELMTSVGVLQASPDAK